MDPQPQERAETLVACAMGISLSVVLHHIRLWSMPNGGSVTLASALPIWIVARRYGLRPGLAAGAGAGLISFVLKPVAVHPVQVLLDYPVAWGALGLAALTHRPVPGAVLATFVRFMAQVASGATFFRSTLPSALDPMLSSMLYNLYLVPDMVIALALLGPLAARAPQLVRQPPEPAKAVSDSSSTRSASFLAAPLLMLLVGLAVFVTALITLRSRLP